MQEFKFYIDGLFCGTAHIEEINEAIAVMRRAGTTVTVIDGHCDEFVIETRTDLARQAVILTIVY